MIEAESWYASANFWTGAGVAIGVLAILVSVILWRFGAPRAILDYSMPTAASLLNPATRTIATSGIEVRFQDKIVKNPYIVSIRIVNSGRKDIRSTDFDQGTPLFFDLGATVLEVLNRPQLESVSIATEGSTVHVGPALIRSQDRIGIDALVDGEPKLTCRALLADTIVRYGSYLPAAPFYVAFAVRSSFFLLVAGFIFFLSSVNSLTHLIVFFGCLAFGTISMIVTNVIGRIRNENVMDAFVPLWPGQRPLGSRRRLRR